MCYIRVSTEEQVVEGVSLQAQEERLRAYCLLNGLEIEAVIADEGISASKGLDTRPGGQRVLDLLRKGAATHVVALKLDRLFRNAEDALRNTSAWDRRGVSLHLLDMGGTSLSTGSAVGRMMLTMLAAFAEFERNLISERTSAALAYKRRKREVFNHAPLGYDRVGNNLVPNSREMAVVKLIRDLRQAGGTLRSIVHILNEGQIDTKRGGRWYPSTVRQILANNMHGEAV